jgi:phosphopantothenoylcysteine decarboxylase / phosphopantothenate---cysteine ligase
MAVGADASPRPSLLYKMSQAKRVLLQGKYGFVTALPLRPRRSIPSIGNPGYRGGVHGKTILLIVGGGIAAFKSLELVRDLRRAGARVTPVLTENGARFVTALSLGALAEAKVRMSLWDLEAEATMGHIALSRSADLIVVCPATADLMARAAAGRADDLASTLLLATDTPVLMVPAMNVRMWLHPATQRNLAALRADGVTVLDPEDGEMACGEFGPGRLPPIAAIMAAVAAQFGPKPLAGRHAIVTAGPTHEAIDPVRYLGNRSSGKQGFAIAQALAGAGARVTLIAGPVALPTPAGIDRIDVASARDMAAAVTAALPADIAVMVAAVADWRVEAAAHKLKKAGGAPPALTLVENPDILAGVGHAPNRPRLVIGFAAETGDLLANAATKLAKKGADWIVANDVSDGVFGTDRNHVHLVSAAGNEDWGAASKAAIAARLVARIADVL